MINLGCTESTSLSSEEGGHAKVTRWEDRDPAVVTLMERRRLLVGEARTSSTPEEFEEVVRHPGLD